MTMTSDNGSQQQQQQQTIGVFGGSFNPVHIGHLMLASYLQQFTGLDAVWLTLSPLNPLKSHPGALIPDLQRLQMLKIATAGLGDGIGVCDIELSMPRPSYTIDTLRVLSRRYPRKRFKLIIGSDNWRIFEQWKDYQEILDNYGVIVYPRPGYPVPNLYEDGMEVVDAPRSSLSSSFVRSAIARGKDMTCFLPPGVFDFIRENNLYVTK